jgi:hypothetical protein
MTILRSYLDFGLFDEIFESSDLYEWRGDDDL